MSSIIVKPPPGPLRQALRHLTPVPPPLLDPFGLPPLDEVRHAPSVDQRHPVTDGGPQGLELAPIREAGLAVAVDNGMHSFIARSHRRHIRGVRVGGDEEKAQVESGMTEAGAVPIDEHDLPIGAQDRVPWMAVIVDETTSRLGKSGSLREEPADLVEPTPYLGRHASLH